MKQTQAFRVAGTTSVENISIDSIHGQNVIFWENIEQVFPGVRVVKCGDVVINILRDPNGVRYEPHRIEHYPDEVLDLVLSTQTEHPPIYSHTAILNAPPVSYAVGTLPSSPNDSEDLSSNPSIALEPIEVPRFTEPQSAALARVNTTYIQNQLNSVNMAIDLANRSGVPLNSEELSSLIHSRLTLASVTRPEFENTVNRKLDAIHHQGTTTQQIAREVLELQKQMQDRLVLIQSKTEAILTQQVGLAEYPIPRLFIVLPEEPSKYDPANWFRNKFRLHFICECGEHTQAEGSKIPHHLHLARHEGYIVREPTELFRKYGPFLLLMLELIKFGTNIAGHAVPALANLKVIELVDSVQQTVATVTAKIDYSLECIDKQMEKLQESSLGDMNDVNQHTPMTQQDLTNYLSNVEGLEGVELRQLRSFLKTSSKDNLLANLYRMATPDGHVKWVCSDHYRVGYQEAHDQRLRDVVKLAGGTFDEQLGIIDIALNSSFAANEFYAALRKGKGVLELILCLKWDCTRKDVEALQDALKSSLVSVLHVDLRQFRPNPAIPLLSTSARYDIFHRLLEPVNLKSVHLILPKDLLKLSNFSPKWPLHLRRLTFEIVVVSLDEMDVRTLAEVFNNGHTRIKLLLWNKSVQEKGGQALIEALKTNTTLSTLDLSYTSIGEKGSLALCEALVANSVLTSLSLCGNSIGERGAQALSEVLKTNRTLACLNLKDNTIGDRGVQMISEALKINSTLISLDLDSNSISEKGAQMLSEVLRINSTLVALSLGSNSIKDKGAQALTEVLKVNSALTSLDLTYNGIGEKGTLVLFEVLRTNSTLTSLTLSRNSFGAKGVQALSKALKTNTTLLSLNLESFWIGDKETQMLCEVLKKNSTLTSLDLKSNCIGEKGALALSEMIKINSTLTTLDLSHNMVGKGGSQALSEALKTNSTLTTLGMNGIMMGQKEA
ncbi:hypothetical protein EMPS_02592 [Entomortierella parvispora]|uniref:RNI-like protein n=1 Tax=Entomortierella parvispora TaxID=205924 RepID=A0A9P3H5Q8_9FUNG|nr:hypothetical protein EMPS_02592 [Entomortierella parvispora]